MNLIVEIAFRPEAKKVSLKQQSYHLKDIVEIFHLSRPTGNEKTVLFLYLGHGHAWQRDGLNPPNPASVRYRFEVDFGGKDLPLVNACFEWSRENPLHLLEENTLNEALQSNNFN